MDIEKLPSPISNASYNTTNFEYLGNLKVIDILWILCPEQRLTAFNNLLFKVEFLKSQTERTPSQKVELEKEFLEWAKKYLINDNVIWYYIEQSYELIIKDFMKGFPAVMEVLKKQDSFIKSVSPEQQYFLNALTESSFCKAIGKGKNPSWWDIINLYSKLLNDDFYKNGYRTVWDIQFKMLKLSLMMVLKPRSQDKMLALLKRYFSTLFGDYMFEVNTHYFFNYFYHKGEFKDILKLDEEDMNIKQELENDGQEFVKIEWKGKQKELAELFVELHRKGFINEIPVKLIEQYFTKSYSIAQTLKPSQDPKTKQNNYEGIYTSAYKPRFDSIRQKS